MKALIVFIVLLFSISPCFAATEDINFTVSNNVLRKDGSLFVTFTGSLLEEIPKLVVKPITDKNVVSIYDKLNKVLVSETAYKSSTLLKYAKVKAEAKCGTSFLLYFEVQDKKTFKVYRTNSKRIWSNCLYANYIQRLNEKLKVGPTFMLK